MAGPVLDGAGCDQRAFRLIGADVDETHMHAGKGFLRNILTRSYATIARSDDGSRPWYECSAGQRVRRDWVVGFLGLDKSVETILVEASPQWLTDLTTRF